MTLVRTALRIATVAALSGKTIAENRVWDSRISELTPETFAQDAKPTIIVLTDEDTGDALNRQNGGPPFRRMVDLTFEIGVTQAEKTEGGWIVGYPDTDARHEASLDWLEFQLSRRLAYELDALPALWRSIARPRSYRSHRQVADAQGVKIACRILTWTCEVSDDQIDPINTLASTPPTGLAALPEIIQRVRAAIPNGSSGADIIDRMADGFMPITAEPYGLTVHYREASADPAKVPGIEQHFDPPEP